MNTQNTQGGKKGASRRQQIIEYGALPALPTKKDIARAKTLKKLELCGGFLSWYKWRQYLGGDYKTALCRQVVEELISEGALVEVWHRPDLVRTSAYHWIALTASIEALPKVDKIRARADIILEIKTKDMQGKW